MTRYDPTIERDPDPAPDCNYSEGCKNPARSEDDMSTCDTCKEAMCESHLRGVAHQGGDGWRCQACIADLVHALPDQIVIVYPLGWRRECYGSLMTATSIFED